MFSSVLVVVKAAAIGERVERRVVDIDHDDGFIAVSVQLAKIDDVVSEDDAVGNRKQAPAHRQTQTLSRRQQILDRSQHPIAWTGLTSKVQTRPHKILVQCQRGDEMDRKPSIYYRRLIKQIKEF